MTGISYWEKTEYFAPQDVIIVGGGFCGLWTALSLTEKNPALSVTILERGVIPTGASTRNAGFSCFGSPSEILSDRKTLGDKKLRELVSMRYAGLNKIRKYFPGDAIGYDASGGYECFRPDSPDWEACAAEIPWINRMLSEFTGIKDTFRHADAKLSAFGFAGFSHMIENELEGGIHPAMLIRALERKVTQNGVRIFNNTTVKSFEESERGVTIQTERNPGFSCSRLVLCTNAFTIRLMPGIDIIPCRGQVFITNPIEKLQIRGTFHFDSGYYYFRNVENRLLLGGARNKDFKTEETLNMDITEKIQKELESFAAAHLLPGIPFTIDQRWSGIMAMGSEKMPIVRAAGKKTFTCVRMSGMGVALAPIVADQIAELVMNS